MLKKVNLLVRVFALLLLPAFFAGPVAASTHWNRLTAHVRFAKGSVKGHSKGLSVLHSSFRYVNPEPPDGGMPLQAFSKAGVPVPPDGRLNSPLASPQPSPRNFRILRI